MKTLTDRQLRKIGFGFCDNDARVTLDGKDVGILHGGLDRQHVVLRVSGTRELRNLASQLLFVASHIDDGNEHPFEDVTP